MLTLYIVWGTTYLGIKVGLDAGLPPALFLSLRLLPAAAILFVVAKWRGVRLSPPRIEARTIAVVGVLLLIGGQYVTFLAEQYMPSGLSALIVALLPLWIALAESVFPDMSRPGPLGWVGLVVGFAGLAILIWPRVPDIATGAVVSLGIALQILATWLWAAGSIYSKRHPVKSDGMVVTAWQMLLAGAITLVIGTLLGEWNDFTVTPKGLGAIVYLTVFGSCIAFTAFIYALKHLPASKVMTYAYVNPVIAVFAGWAAGRAGLVPAEPVNASIVVGMTVIVAGVALTTAAPTLPPRRAEATGDPATPLVTPADIAPTIET